MPMNKIINKIVFLLSIVIFLNACTPSIEYRNGQGFYSENPQMNKYKFNSLLEKGKAQDLGYFSVSNGGCGFYSPDAADNGVVIPAVQEKLKLLGGNVANGIKAKESFGVDFLLGFLIIPAFLACSNYTVSGNAFIVTTDDIK